MTMIPFGRHRFQPLFTTVLPVLGLFALAMAQTNPASRNAQPPNPVNQLLSGQGRRMIDQAVTLSNIAIQKITQGDILWVGTTPNDRTLVMHQPSVNPIDARGNPTPVAANDLVRVTGYVRPAPSVQVLQGWGISPAYAARVQQQGVVVQAVTFEVTRR